MTALAATSTWPPHVGGRTNQPVRRDSKPFEAGERFFRPLMKATVVHIMRGAERLALASLRTRGVRRLRKSHYGELALPDLAVLQALLFDFMDWKTGRCAPTYSDLEERTGHARDTIAAALKRLAACGILERLRRFRMGQDAEGRPKVEQAPNAYRFALPKKLRALLGLPEREASVDADGRLTWSGGPIPDDAAAAQAERKRGVKRLDAEASGLSRALEQWGEALGTPRVGRIG